MVPVKLFWTIVYEVNESDKNYNVIITKTHAYFKCDKPSVATRLASNLDMFSLALLIAVRWPVAPFTNMV